MSGRRRYEYGELDIIIEDPMGRRIPMRVQLLWRVDELLQLLERQRIIDRNSCDVYHRGWQMNPRAYLYAQGLQHNSVLVVEYRPRGPVGHQRPKTRRWR